MTDRRIDLRSVDIGKLNPPSTRRMLDIRDKREPGLILRLTSKSKTGAQSDPGLGAIGTAPGNNPGSYSATGPR